MRRIAFPALVFLTGLFLIVVGGLRGSLDRWDSLTALILTAGLLIVIVAAYLAGVFTASFWFEDIDESHPNASSRWDQLDRSRRGAHNDRHGR